MSHRSASAVSFAEAINVRWRKLGWAELVREFKPRSIGAELVEVEA